jgi:DNA recombination protein RmuC
MNGATPALILAVLGLLAGALGAGCLLVAARRRAETLLAEVQTLKIDLARERERRIALEEGRAAAADVLKAQAASSAQIVAEHLIARAAESFRTQEQISQARLEAQLKPVADTLVKFEAQVQAIEKARAEDSGGLKSQITALMQASAATQAEARRLSNALRRGAGVQGRWGEQTLRNVLEAAGLANRFDFEEQFSLDTEEGRRRPDVKVRMPGGGVFVIDAKCSLNAFLDAQDLSDEEARDAAYHRHAASVRNHMSGLSAKAYWEQFQTEGSPDFVAMFVPGDGFLAAALDRLPDLMTEAMDKRVLIVTPTTLFALCKAVAYGWRVESQAKNAEAIAKLGKELYRRLAVMGGHASALGKALDTAVGRYNAFVGSLESQVMVQARRFEDLSADYEGKTLPELTRVETGVRPLAKVLEREPMSDLVRDERPALTLEAS